MFEAAHRIMTHSCLIFFPVSAIQKQRQHQHQQQKQRDLRHHHATLALFLLLLFLVCCYARPRFRSFIPSIILRFQTGRCHNLSSTFIQKNPNHATIGGVLQKRFMRSNQSRGKRHKARCSAAGNTTTQHPKQRDISLYNNAMEKTEDS